MTWKDFIDELRRLFFGWSHHDDDQEPQEPQEPDAPLLSNAMEIRDGKVLIDGRILIGVCTFSLLCDLESWPDRPAIRAYLERLAGSTGDKPPVVNAIFIAGLMHFKPTDLAPWLKDRTTGKWVLPELSSEFLARAEMIYQEARRLGMIVVPYTVEHWSIRHGGATHPLNPKNHIDNNAVKIMAQEDWDHPNCGPRQRTPFKCKHSEGCECDQQIDIGSRTHPAWWLLIRHFAALARQYGGFIVGGNEMYTDFDHQQWDVPAFKLYAQTVYTHVRDVAPNVLIGHCVAPIDWPVVVPYANIADLHSLAYCDCDPAKIAQGLNDAREYARGMALLVNTDGCMSSPRFDRDWLVDVGTRAFQAGAGGLVMIEKDEHDIHQGILDAAVELRKCF